MAAPAYESSAGAALTDVNALVITKPSGTAEGDLLLAMLDFWDDTADISTGTVSSSGWTVQEYEYPDAVVVDCIAWKIAGGSEPADYTFTFSWGVVDGCNGGILRISGVNTSAPLAAVVGATGGATAPNPPSSGTVPLNDYLACIAAHDSNATHTPPAEFTERVDVSFSGIATSTRNAATAADPGAFGDASINFWSAYTVLVAPPSVAGTTGGTGSLGGLRVLRSLGG